MTQSYVSLPLNVKIFIVNSACHNGTDFWGRQKVKMIFHLQLLLRLKFVGLYRHSKYRLTFSRQLQYTGLFISPSGISDPCGTVAGMVTPKGSMTTEGETLQVSVLPYRCSICWLLRAPDKRFSHTLDSLGRWPRPASSFRRAQAATLMEFHVPLTNCFVRRWFCAVHGPKPPLHRHNWLSFGKFQDTERFLIHCARFFRHDYPLAVEPASTPRPLVQKKTLRDSLPIDMLLSALSFLVIAQSSSEVPEGLMNNPVYALLSIIHSTSSTLCVCLPCVMILKFG